MATADQILALVRSFIADENDRFLAIASQVATHESRQGHHEVARQLKDLIESAKRRQTKLSPSRRPVPIIQPKGELANLLSASFPEDRLSDLVLSSENHLRLKQVIHEQRQRDKLAAHGLVPRHKLLLIGPPGTGKTMTARALAGELRLPLFVVRLDGLITKFMGETASKLRLVFEAIAESRGVYLFDEFDALGAQRAADNDVGEIRRILNSFLQFLEAETANSIIIGATNHPEILDKALFRRFDDVITYTLPDPAAVEEVIRNRLANFDTANLEWVSIRSSAQGLSQADIVRACEEAAKAAVLEDSKRISESFLLDAFEAKRHANRLQLQIGDIRNAGR
ncbi:MAG: AAA family ATPase [Ferrovibrio sp.]|uniref:AAA family ATPase n=1 Tax=Ferrovibrio sp. TaxID=1917215 RepID=UPI00391978F8